MENQFTVERHHLKNACQNSQWDLLDKLLELDNSLVNDNSMFSDSWGQYWGMLYELILRNEVEGIQVLLKHDANPREKSWGDGMNLSCLELAEGKVDILRILKSKGNRSALYTRTSEPEWPMLKSKSDEEFNRKGRLKDKYGLVFPTD